MIIIRARAKQDLQQIKEYIVKDSVFYAHKTITDIKNKINYLKLFPEMGKIIELNDIKVRQLIYKSYKIFYIFNSKNIYILRIIHHFRKLFNLGI